MMRKKAFVLIAFLVVLGAVFFFWPRIIGAPAAGAPPAACTLEAKICPDGSAVGRAGPDCQFAKCPGEASSSPAVSGERAGVLKGRVTLSPVCPLERIPPDPRCAAKPYLTKIMAFTSDGTELVKTVQSRSDGSFEIALPFGDYNIEAGGGEVYPRCQPALVSIENAAPLPIAISCDTGLR